MDHLGFLRLWVVVVGLLSHGSLAHATDDLTNEIANKLGALATLDTKELPADLLDRPLSKDQAKEVQQLVWKEWAAKNKSKFAKEYEEKKIDMGELSMKWLEKRFSPADAKNVPLFISMHGGGGAPPQVNDQQWQNQIKLYEPTEGIVIAPRAPGNTWDLWHQGHIDPFFDHLIQLYVATQDVDPNRIYLMGYSAGGDGVYQVAPRLADRFAAASMMAGHPNESQPDGLRNLPFALFMGGKDAAYNRNQIVVQWSKKLDELQEKDPQGYIHQLKVYEDKSHWMGGNDREALSWMLKYTRDLLRDKIVWRQDDVLHRDFYWLSVGPSDPIAAGTTIAASHDQNDFQITTDYVGSIRIQLNDALADLDAPIRVQRNGKQVFEGKVTRSLRSILDSLQLPDPNRLWPASIELKGM